MFFKQFYLPDLGHASYLVGSEETGEALVLDPRRDVDEYFASAQEQGLRIGYAGDTHQHNDYLSGVSELPAREDVKLLAPARAELGYPVRRMADGQTLELGEVVFQFLDTPGHTPEHTALLVTDRSRSEEPAFLLSGGALLVGDVARPDLLGGGEATRRNARDLCHTLRDRILTLPDHVQVYPTHVAGSLCGGSIDSRLSTTVGYEKRANRMLERLAAEEEFVDQCVSTHDLPAVPPYWRRMRKLNQDGPPLLGVLAPPSPLGVDAFERKSREEGVSVLDCRSPEAFSAHVPGALNVGAGTSFSTWAGTVLPADDEILLVVEDTRQIEEICWQLVRIGYRTPTGFLSGGMMAWRTSGRPIETMDQWSAPKLKSELDQGAELTVLDVRQPAERHEGHIPGSHYITGAELPARLGELPADRPVAVICGSGYRSSVTASLLSRQGFPEVVNVLGGMTAWENHGYETEPGA